MSKMMKMRNVLKLLWIYRVDLIGSLDRIHTTSSITPQVLGWHHWCFTGGEKPVIYCDGETLKDEVTVKFWMKYEPPKASVGSKKK